MRRKGRKQKEVRTLPNVFHGKPEEISDSLVKYFRNEKPLVLELGCGNGEYTLALAQKFPDKNFVGVDLKGSRIWTGAKKALALSITNAAFIITKADRLHLIFNKPVVEEIWIPFPNPFPLRKSIKQRLVHKRFLDVYGKICLQEAKIHLKTDAEILYQYALKVIEEEKLILVAATDDLYSSDLYKEEITIQTKYEQQHIKDGKSIKYVCSRLQ
ncbi:tRNA (guanosine(46)-N7)-methyltransferase TrmB [Ignavibacterium sp.]|uniref:tRNA (guanosine(46)-N7)-methyltransferase TrmB n=1 Tax=Ignavibacterium sp. TaxID=2651167 RepID=UPI00307D9D05